MTSHKPILRLSLAALVAGTLALQGCGKKNESDVAPAPSPAEPQVLVRVNSDQITDRDLNDYLQLRQAQLGPQGDKVKEREMALDELVDRTLLVQYASGKKLDKDPEVAAVLSRARSQILIQAVQRQELKDHPVTDEEAKKRFEEEAAKAHKIEYRIRHILVREEAEAQKIIEDLGKGAKFDKIARDKSVDVASGKKGGDIGWVNQGMVVPEFFQAATQMKKGDRSTAPVKTQFGYHIIAVDDTRDYKLPTFEDFTANPNQRQALQRQLQQERLANVVKDLKGKATIVKQ